MTCDGSQWASPTPARRASPPTADTPGKAPSSSPAASSSSEETANTAIVQAAPTVTVNPRRGNLDKAPWKDLDLSAITGQTVENRHLFNVHLGETIAPYVALEPLKALLPLKQGDAAIPTDDNGPGGIRLGGLERRMRERWQTVSRLWEDNKALANRLNLLGQMDYVHNCRRSWSGRTTRIPGTVSLVYTNPASQRPPIKDDNVLVDYTAFLGFLQEHEEGNYLLAIINSDALQTGSNANDGKGQFGARVTCKSTCGSCPSRSSTRRMICIKQLPRPGQRRQPLRRSSWRNCGSSGATS